MRLTEFRPENKNFRLLIIVLLGFLVRLVFLLWGADKLLGSGKYIMGDTYGWTESFKNLVEHGVYSFNLSNPEAAFGRVPGFSFFWGIHYLLFGDYAYQAVAITQMLLDTAAIILIYKITFNIYRKPAIALIASFLYAFYPFIIAWITVSYSELLANFTALLILSVLTRPDKAGIHYILIGLLCAAGFLVREFLGILLPISLATIFLLEKTTYTLKFKRLSLLFISFLALYSLWPLRNYLNHDRIVPARTMGGFEMYDNDFQSFRMWVNSWDPDETKWVEAVTASNKPVSFPPEIFQSDAEAQKATDLVALARSCGSSFQHWQARAGINRNSDTEHCNEEITAGFDELRNSYIKNNTARYLTDVPLRNLKKAVFKSSFQEGTVVQSSASRLIRLVFGYRSMLLLLGLLGILLSIKNKYIFPVAAFSLSMYFVLCFVIRFLEMRNLLQSDTVLLIPAAFTIFKLYSLWLSRQHTKNIA